MSLLNRDLVTVDDLSYGEMEAVFSLADEMSDSMAQQLDTCRGKVLACLFFEPSTRTRLSFEAAMHRLGGDVVGFASAGTSSAAKGESLADTIRTVDQYVDLIVIRHPMIGSAKEAARVDEAPVMNGGDGAGQHPTQALLDLFTIQSERGSVDGNTIVLCGDLKNGRTVHAGIELYKHYDCKMIFVAPDRLKMPAQITSRLREDGVQIAETAHLEEALEQADVLYMTRIQKERFEDPQEYERLKDSYILSRETVERIRPDVTVMHPLPRVNEITTDVDALPGAAYFRQVRNGVFVRMALIALVAGKI